MVSWLFAAVSLFQEKPVAFEILLDDFSAPAIYLDAVSRDGKNILCHEGRFSSHGPNSYGATGAVYLVRRNSVRQVLQSKPANFLLYAVGNDGSVLGNAILQTTTGSTMRPFLIDKGETRWLSPPDSAPLMPRLAEATGFASDGSIFVETVGDPLGYPDQFWKVTPSKWIPLFNLPHAPGNSIVDDTPLGYVANVPVGGRGSAAGGAYFDGDRPIYLQSRFAKQIAARVCSADGEVVAGFTYVPSSEAVIWRRGQVAFRFKNSVYANDSEWTSVSDDGKLAVGRFGRTNPKFGWVWRESESAEELGEFLKDRKIEVPDGWTPFDALSVSANGSEIIGHVRNKDGRIRPFRVSISMEG